MDKVTYRCKNCGWSKSIAAQWSDSRPTFCANRKCDFSTAKATRTKKSFRTMPDMLEIIMPKKPEPPPKHVPVSMKQEKKESKQEEASQERKKKRRGYAPKEKNEGISEEQS